MVSRLAGTPDHAGWLAIRVDTAGLLYAAAAIAGGANFFGAGVRAAKSLRLDMNFLMSAALVAALLIGEAFEAATLAFLFSLAELLERYAVARGRRSIARLLELAPETANRVSASGVVETVLAADLRPDDLLRIRPGDRIPVDGRVAAGASAVNEATITGEALPRPKKTGDPVFAGTLNTDGALEVIVTADAAHSTLARIGELIRQAETRRAPSEMFVKRFARVYTPIVTALAVLVMFVPPFLGFGSALDWFVRGITLLVIACPCALVIATPVTVVSALTSAARNGVLIKGGDHLEALGAIKALAIDKTGTLTTGQLEVTGFTADGIDPKWLLHAIVTLESRSEHPVGEAIVRYGHRLGVAADASVTSFTSIPGQGVRGCIRDIDVTVGTDELVGDSVAEHWGSPEPGMIAVYASTGDGRSAKITLRDELRAGAAETVSRLHMLGIRPIIMLTGDAVANAQAVARATGVDEVRWRLLPAGKVEAVRELRQLYGTVGMLGDGVNDAPALASATVGLAMGAAGSPATIETADIALMGDDLNKLPYAVHLARRARRMIRFNIGLALTAKLLLAVGAVAGVVSLAVAVLVGDMGGSLAVTINALRLARTSSNGDIPPSGTSPDGARTGY
ncbi:MAG: cation-translocating P-type ATPase [Gemmatimonadales bacterium]